MEDKELEAYEEELGKLAFKWAEAKGRAQVQEQVRVSVRITRRATTPELTEKDWEFIMASSWQWDDREMAYLKKMKENGNEANIRDPEFAQILGRQRVFTIKNCFSSSRVPYYLSYSSTKHTVSFKKRLVRG